MIYELYYQKRSQSNLVKTFFVLQDEFLTGYKHSFKKQLPKVFYKKAVLKNLAILIGKHLRWSLFWQLYYKETPTQVLSLEHCEIFKNIYFKGHLRTTEL